MSFTKVLFTAMSKFGYTVTNPKNFYHFVEKLMPKNLFSPQKFPLVLFFVLILAVSAFGPTGDSQSDLNVFFKNSV